MNARIAIALVLALVVLGGGALYLQQQRGAQRPAEVSVLGQPLLKGLKVAEVGAIRIREADSTLTLERRDARWIIAERDGFAADLGKVRDFLVHAIELKIGQSEAIGDKDRARLKLDAAGTQVEFLDGAGKPLAAFIAGSKYFKSTPENPEKAAADGRFVLLPGEPGRVIVVASPLVQATARSAEWIDQRGYSIERVRSLEYRPAGGEGWKVERGDENADWKLAGARANEKVEAIRANSASYVLRSLDIADVAPREVKPQETGLDRADLITATTFDGLTYAIRVGSLAGDRHYVTATVAGEPKPEGKDAEERARQLAGRLPHEQALSKYLLLVARNRLEDVLKPRAGMLVRPDAKK
jgi:hypothetical protein